MQHDSTTRAALGFALVVVAVGSCRCPEPFTPIESREQIDVFSQRDAARVDILWVVDDSGSMAAEQQKLGERFDAFFHQLVVSRVDFHIGVVSTDASEHGVLRAYRGDAVDGCAGCRFLTSDVADAALVFADLVATGTSGSSFEEPFAAAAAALGVDDVHADGTVHADPPAENAGFVRDDAALYIIFVTDEDDQTSADVGFYTRLFEGLKGRGGENRVTVAGITGYPDAVDVPIEDVCAVLGDVDDPRRVQLHDALVDDGADVCHDADFAADAPNAGAKAGGRVIDLACATGGVVANICSGDYERALDALGADAAGLVRRFRPSACVSDALTLDCDDNGRFDDDVDGPVCVTAAGLPLAAPVADCAPTGEPELVPRSQTCGYDIDDVDGSIYFPGAFIPKPGTDVEIRYGRCAVDVGVAALTR